MGICLIIEWFVIQRPSTLEVQYSDHHLFNGLVFKPPFEYWSAIQITRPTKVFVVAKHFILNLISHCSFSATIVKRHLQYYQAANLKSKILVAKSKQLKMSIVKFTLC